MWWLIVPIGPLLGAITWFTGRLWLKHQDFSGAILSDVIKALYLATAVKTSVSLVVLGGMLVVVTVLLRSQA